VESSLDTETMSLKTRALYNNADGKIKPGRSATIEIKLQEIENAIVVPSHAIIAEMGRDIAYIYQNGKAKEVVLQKGLRDATSLQITNGLKIGDTLIVTGVMQIRNGMDVVIDNILER
jgi:membrane fusion protein (multidrug efflux system)